MLVARSGGAPHPPGNAHPIQLYLEIDQYGACFEILSVHGLYYTNAIAC